MAKLSVQEIATKLLSEGFGRSGPATGTLSDPIADTPMVVTLDELRPYELDPRLTRNPLYDEIKASIRERGLDAPPPITRRPGADHYIIRNGGNTRLAILRELWTQTREERFYRIACLFRPWPERGEIIALTGHLAENELHGGLTFIERALGVAKARELYEAEAGKPLSQSELARRLKADGYPVPQPHISRMQETIQYLLPAIPSVLYTGLGRHQIEQLTALRRAGQNIWNSRSNSRQSGIEFSTLFQDVLAIFDGDPGGFSVQRVQDELIGQMADLLGANYDTLALEITDSEKRWQALGTEPASAGSATSPPPPARPATPPIPPVVQVPASIEPTLPETPKKGAPSPASRTLADAEPDDPEDARDDLLREHIVTPAETTERLRSIQRLIVDHAGEKDAHDFARDVVRAIPVQAGGLYPISDVWYIEPTLDDPGRLRLHVGQLAIEIASEAHLDPGAIMLNEEGIGFECRSEGADRGLAQRPFPHTLLALLQALSSPYQLSHLGGHVPIADLGTLLLGHGQAETVVHLQMSRLSDAGLVKLYRLIRLARRLLELEAREAGDDGPPPEA